MIDICKRVYDSMADQKIYRTRGNTGFYPSQGSIDLDNGEVAGGCHRQVYYQWKGFEQTEEGVTDYSLAAEMGEWIHNGIGEYLKDNVVSTGLIVLSDEQSFFNQHGLVSGRTDLFLMDVETKELFGCEIKSVGGFAGKKSLMQPSIENMIQTGIYLNEYQMTAKQGQAPVDSWVILYVSRDENWDLKGRKHGSPFRFMWQFTCTFENDMMVVYDQRGGRTEYPELTVENIYNRYDKIRLEIAADTLPDRDYAAQYSEEKIMTLYKSGGIQFKKDIAVVDKWIAKGAKAGELELALGDSACMFCSWKTLCYSSNPKKGTVTKQKLYNISNTPKPIKKQANNLL